jgi:hypothetical protein
MRGIKRKRSRPQQGEPSKSEEDDTTLRSSQKRTLSFDNSPVTLNGLCYNNQAADIRSSIPRIRFREFSERTSRQIFQRSQRYRREAILLTFREVIFLSGHSKWANIKHRKAAQDAKRGNLFQKLVKAVIIAAKEGGGDPSMNMRLKAAIERAKAASVPNDNIIRGLRRRGPPVL